MATETPQAWSKVQNEASLGMEEGVLPADGPLAITSPTEQFREFFGIKDEFWTQFCRRLRTEVTEYSSWDQILEVEAHRWLCAVRFLHIYGDEYWGSEQNGDQYLLEELVANDETWKYPDNDEVICFGLYLLLGKFCLQRSN
ncbi:hypothetical protein N7466_003677 [Penicillium verhagenii]|uniref:uncharacterized protein n=1 Tax=Penicillium verhagenii TaxID=1562060 RepID=UPI00254546B0|nr:uncharacterized protein N7466_003677 [Penicillium verhagenii]KAJ5934130.1 hypothetical protein N7466_003677 [Penicillium verhagenii]